MKLRYLNVVRDGQVIGTFSETFQGGIQFDYEPGYSGRPISYSMPVGKSHASDAPRNWLEGLLPEGDALKDLKAQHGLDNFLELLNSVGTDIAGDCILTSENRPGHTQIVQPRPIDSNTVVELISRARAKNSRGLMTIPKQRMSLGGVQSKFSVRISEGGQWSLSTISHPSTHIVKPGSNNYPFADLLEATTLNFASTLGIRTSNAGVLQTPLGLVFVTERFDRDNTKRIGIEDLSQVLAYRPKDKYKFNEKALFKVLRASGFPEQELLVLISQIVYNTHIGNADAHLKNYSVFLGSPTVCPLYDSVPTICYNGLSEDLAMPVMGARRAKDVTLRNWIDWGLRLGIPKTTMQPLVEHIVGSIRTNLSSYFASRGLPPEFAKNILIASSSI